MGIGAFHYDTSQRRFIIMDNYYLGLAPLKAQRGDLVCVLFGCSVPMILREWKGVATFVGESYVHGLMFGVAINVMREEKLQEREWVIY
jgi:hypothetical protein